MKRNYWIAVLAVLIVIGAGLGAWQKGWLGPVNRQAAAPSAPGPETAPKPPATATLPSFDAVNVGPDGNAVIAGRAAPGAEVTVLAGGNPVGHGKADANGEWVIMTDHPLPPGPQSLSLAARGPDGTAASSSSSLALVVPPHGEAAPPVAVLLPQGTEAARALGSAARAARHVALDVVEYDADGRVVLSGGADPGATVAIAIDGQALASVKADAAGDWSATIGQGIPVGRYRLTLAGRAADGSDAGEIALEMRRPAPGEGDALAVVPGNTLWHLAQRSFGAGLRYVEIYRANRETIDNPDRIYPGQVLALPRNP